MFANGLENNPDLLRLGQQLTVLPVNGILHTVVKGRHAGQDRQDVQSQRQRHRQLCRGIASIARNPQIAVGQKLIVPGG